MLLRFWSAHQAPRDYKTGVLKESHGVGLVPPALWSSHWSLEVIMSSILYFLKPAHVDQTPNDKYVLTTKNTL